MSALILTPPIRVATPRSSAQGASLPLRIVPDEDQACNGSSPPATRLGGGVEAKTKERDDAGSSGLLAITRRRALQIAAAAALFSTSPVRAAEPRIAAIDWGLLETALAIGIVPVAATELIQYRKIVVEPEIPASVADLGLRGTPNYELLQMIAPDLILISGFYEYQRAALERIAPVLSLPIYEAGKPPYALAERTMLALGERLGRSAAAMAYAEAANAQIAALNSQLASLANRPAFVISLGDARHFRAFGRDSMFGDVLGRLGIHNAWTDDTSYSAAAPVGLEALAKVPDASIVIVGPLPAEVGRAMPDNALWNALPAVLEDRVSILDPIDHFGGLPSARRFARLLGEAWQSRASNG